MLARGTGPTVPSKALVLSSRRRFLDAHYGLRRFESDVRWHIAILEFLRLADRIKPPTAPMQRRFRVGDDVDIAKGS